VNQSWKEILMRIKITFGFLFFFLSLSLSGLDLRFIQKNGMEYRIVSEVQEGVWKDDVLIGQSSILNRIGVKVADSDKEGATLDVQYSISEKSLDTGLYIYSSQEETEFYRSSRGVYSHISDDEYLPSVRDIPTFPEEGIEPGTSWSEMAEEVHDLHLFFSVDYRLHIPFRVFYTYEGRETFEGRGVDVIQISYHYLKSLDPGMIPSAASGVNDLPREVSGDFKQKYLWDEKAGIPAAVNEIFRITYGMSSGIHYTFKGTAQGRVTEADQWVKDDVLKTIKDAVTDMDDVSVALSNEGVVLTLDDVHFKPDSAEFLAGEEEKLFRIKDLLLKYSGHDLLITGHTAEVGNSADHGQALSESRAAAVASFLLKQGVRDSSRMVVQGKGSSDPVGDNSREEGRKKNRRVEITILDN